MSGRRTGWIQIGEHRAPIPGPETSGHGIERREFLKGFAAVGAGGLLASILGRPDRALAESTVSFPDGIAAGDPLPTGSVICARVSQLNNDAPIPVLWLVAEDESMQTLVRGGIELARSENGHSVKAQVRGLRPDRWYHYQFYARGGQSVVGRLRTAPQRFSQPDRLRYAFASCQQRTSSFYVAHKGIIQEDVDFFMHLGDYIYVSDGGDTTLEKYRNRWRIFRSHPLLQELHAAVPVVAMWDDGEFYNGVDRTGDPDRLHAARTAWFENMPVVRRRDDRVYRKFQWGRLADVMMIDVRSYRDPEVPANISNYLPGLDAQDSTLPGGEEMFAEGRTTLGKAQERWLKSQLSSSRADWRFIGNPYNMNPWKFLDLDTPEAREEDPGLQRNAGIYVSNEAWDDYQAERKELLEFLIKRRIDNVVFTSGHTHFYIASELQPDFDDPASPTAAFDFVTGSLTADPDPRSIAPEPALRFFETLMLQQNDPYMKHVDLLEQGYAVVDVTPEELIVEFRGIDTFDANATPYTFAKFRILNGSSQLEVLPVE